MKIYRYIHRLSLLIGVVTILVPVLFWNRIPERIPLHYNAAGAADSYGDKSSLILLFFLIVMLMGMMSIAVYFVKANMESKYSASSELSQMHVVYPMLILMNLFLQLTMSYLVFCCVTGRSLGIFFLPVFLVGIAAPLVCMLYRSSKISKPAKEIQKRYKEQEKQEQGNVYFTRIDWWFGLLLGGTVLIMLWDSAESLVLEGKVEWFMWGTTILIAGMILPIFKIRYVLYREHLLVSMGFYGSVRIPYENICSMKKTSNPLSSAAASLKRIQIDYLEKGCHQMILISPKDRDAFMEEINKRKQDQRML